MQYRDILVHLGRDDANERRVQAAIELAVSQRAHLTGVHIKTAINYPIYDMAYLPTTLIEDQEREVTAAARAAEEQFVAACRRAGVPYECIIDEGVVDRVLSEHSRYYDLLVIGQPNRDEDRANDVLTVDYTVLTSACPVMLIPYIGVSAPPGKHIMLAWNGSREAARAAQGALALLQDAERVDVISVSSEYVEDDLPTADICRHLARHDVKTTGSTLTVVDIDVGNALLSALSDRDIDLLVLGAYGHNRLRESVLGGVTRQILDHMTVPVLMAH